MKDGAVVAPDNARPVLAYVCDHFGRWSWWAACYSADLREWRSVGGAVVFWRPSFKRPAPWWCELPAVPAVPAVPVQIAMIEGGS